MCVLGGGCIWEKWGRNCGNRVLVTWCSGSVIMWPQREERKAGAMDSPQSLRKTGHRPSSTPGMGPPDRVLPPELWPAWCSQTTESLSFSGCLAAMQSPGGSQCLKDKEMECSLHSSPLPYFWTLSNWLLRGHLYAV